MSSLKRETVLDLGEIMKRKFNTELGYPELEKFAYRLVGYFDLLIKINYKDQFENRPERLIDGQDRKKENKGNEA